MTAGSYHEIKREAFKGDGLMRIAKLSLCMSAAAAGSCGPKVASVTPPRPTEVDWCHDHIEKVVRLGADMKCEDSPNYFTAGMIADRDKSSSFRLDFFVPEPKSADFLEKVERTAQITRDYRSSASLSANAGFDPSSLGKWATKWIPTGAFKAQSDATLQISVSLKNAEYHGYSSLISAVSSAIRGSTAKSEQCARLTELRDRLCMKGAAIASRVLVATPTIDVKSTNGAKISFDANVTKLAGLSLKGGNDADDHVTMSSDVPLAIAVQWSSFENDMLCTEASLAKCTEPPPPPPPPPTPTAGPVTEVVRNGSGRDMVRITVQHNGAIPLIDKGRYSLTFVSADPSQERDLIDATTGTVIKDFNSASNAQDSWTQANAPHVFKTQYHSAFGTFRMNNGQDTWTATITPGDKVVFYWGQ